MQLSGPAQNGRGIHGQYVYLIVFSHPTDAEVQQHGLRRPSEFTKTPLASDKIQFSHRRTSVFQMGSWVLVHKNPLASDKV